MKYIHIAGTNGKGSVAEYIYNIIMASGASCGCFTSPHLLCPTERMSINGQDIDKDTLHELMVKVKKDKLAVNKTLFAQYTATAFLWFCEHKPEYVVLETGLGGRFDPTNVINDKLVVLTSISHDHMQYLGEDIRDIAREKSGIIKQGNQVISAKQRDEVTAIIEIDSANKDAELIFSDEVKIISSDLSGQVFSYKGREYSIQSIGRFQPLNAALAIECANLLNIDDTYIKKGLGETIIKARTQYIAGQPPMLIDGAHNPAAVSALVDTLYTHFPDKPKVLLFACMQDKDYAKMVDLLAQNFLHVVVVSADILRGADVHELKQLFSKHTVTDIEIDISSGIKLAKKIAQEKDALLVVCGSLYLAGSKFI